MTFAVMVFALVLSTNFAFAQKDMSGMDKSKEGFSVDEMHASRQHKLSMAYKNTLETFARTLLEAAKGEIELQPEFARALVAEIRRSADKMKEIHAEHLSLMSAETRAAMSDMMAKKKEKDAAQEENIKALEMLVKSDYLNIKEIIKNAEPLAGGGQKMEMKEEHKMKDKDSMKKNMK